MTVSFPRAWPSQLRSITQTFAPEPMLEVSPFRSGEQVAKELGETLWRMTVQTPTLSEDDHAELSAWHATLTSIQPFYGYDILRRYPRAYNSGWGGLLVGGSPFNGTGRIASLTAAKTLGLGTLPPGFVLQPGDYLQFDYTDGITRRALHQIVEGGVAAAGGTVTVEVRPFIRPGWSVNAVVQFFQPSAKMLIVPGSWQAPSARNRTSSVSFESLQTLG